MPSHDPRIIVALDLPSQAQALALAERLDPKVCRVKVGLELFVAAGPAILRDLSGLGYEIFLDLKFHDIPTTVGRAVERACALDVWMLNVHALGGLRMLEAASKASQGSATRLIGVTILTSHDEADLAALGLSDAPARVQALAALCRQAGLHGVVCSAQEAGLLRAAHGPQFTLVTPGIRPQGAGLDDQRRVLTITQALLEGAHYLVLGRPITQASDPKAALEACVMEVARYEATQAGS